MIKKSIGFIAMLILVSCVISFSGCTPKENSNMQAGEWEDDIFTNHWSNITFKCPSDFAALDPEQFEPVPGEPKDFFLLYTDQGTNISLYYVDLLYKNLLNTTPEDYFNTMKQQLTNQGEFTFVYSDEFESAFIAGEEYLVLHTEILSNNRPIEEGFYQDSYIRKFDNAFIVFLTAYFGNSKDAVESFLLSIDSAVPN